MRRRAWAWVRKHPLRVCVYVLMAAGLAWGAVTAAGVWRGERNELLTRVVNWRRLRSFVERQGIVSYSVGALRIEKGGVEAQSIDVAVPRAPGSVTLHLDSVRGSLAQVTAVGVRVGMAGKPHRLGLDYVEADVVKRTAQGQGLRVEDGLPLPMTTVEGFKASFSGGAARGVDVPGAVTVASADAAGVQWAAGKLHVGAVNVAGVRADLREDGELAGTVLRIRQTGEAWRGGAERTLAALRGVIERVRGLLWWVLLIAVAAVMGAKLWLTKLPWWQRAALAPAPVLLAWLAPGLTWTSVAAGLLLAVVLALLAYRRSPEWHQKWEPAVFDAFGVPLIAALLLAWRFPVAVPELPRLPDAVPVSIARLEASDLETRVQLNRCGPAPLATLRVDHARLLRLATTVSADVNRVAASTSVDLERGAGRVGIHRSLPGLDRVTYIPEAWRSVPQPEFCVAASIRPGGGSAAIPSGCSVTKGLVRVSAGAVVDPVTRLARVSGQLAAEPARVTFLAEADQSGARLAQFEASGPFTLRGGAGNVDVGERIATNLKMDEASVAAGALQAVRVKATTAGLCASGPMKADVAAASMSVAAKGTRVETGPLAIHVARDNRSSFAATVRAASNRVQTPEFRFDIPTLEVDAQGRTPDVPGIPEWAETSARVRLRRANRDVALEIAPGVRARADLWRGAFSAPRQQATLVQDLTRRVPPRIPFGVEAAGERASVQVPQLLLHGLPARVELNGIQVDLAGRAVALRTGWNRVTPPSLPREFRVDAVPFLHAATRGTIDAFPREGALESDLRSLGDWARRVAPPVPETLEFQLTSDLRRAEVQTRGGALFRFDGLNTRLHSLRVDDLRFRSADVETRAGLVALRAAITDATARVQMTEPLPLDLTVEAERLQASVTNRVDLAELIARLEPYLREAGVRLDGVSVGAALERADVDARFAGNSLAAVEAGAALGGGALLTLDVDKALGAPAQTLHRVEIAAPVEANVKSPGGLFPRLEMTATGKGAAVKWNGGQAAADFTARVQAAFAPPAAASTIERRAREAATELARHATRAFPGAAARPESLRWNLTLASANGGPIYAVRDERLTLSLATRIDALTWPGGEVSGTLQVDATAAIVDDDHLLLDLAAPVDVSLALAGTPAPTRWQLRVPLLAVLRRALEPGNQSALFHAAYYDKLWAAHHPAHAAASPAPLFEYQNLIRIPGQTLRAAIGYGDRLQLLLPWQAEALYGDARGTLEAAVDWSGAAPLIDVGLAAAFNDLQAAPLGDILKGDLRLTARRFPWRERLAARFLRDASRVTELDTVSLDLSAASQPYQGRGPAYMQARASVNVRAVDEVLRLLLDGASLTGTPIRIRYDTLAVQLGIDNGVVDRGRQLARLTGASVKGVRRFESDSNLTLRWGNPDVAGEKLRLRNLIYMVQRTGLLGGGN